MSSNHVAWDVLTISNMVLTFHVLIVIDAQEEIMLVGQAAFFTLIINPLIKDASFSKADPLEGFYSKSLFSEGIAGPGHTIPKCIS